MHIWQKRLALALSGVLVLSGALSGCGEEQNEAAAVGSGSSTAQQTENTTETADTAAHHDTVREDKTETVYAKANADGSISDALTVEGTLKNSGTGTITDNTDLYELQNTSGDETFREEGDLVVWENHGEDISYKGKSKRTLPVDVSISYQLDGKEIDPQELVGKSGHVTIRFDYENKTSVTETVDGKTYTVPVPFTVFSTAMLPEDKFYNVKVSNGKTLSMDGDTVAIGYTCPGLKDSLQLSDDWADELELPDYVEISADTTDFELEFTATVISNGLFEDLDVSDMESDLDEFVDDMAELSDASGELADGSEELASGIGTLSSYFGQYVASVGSLDEGTQSLAAGMQTLNTQKGQLAEGADALESGLNALSKSLDGITLPSGNASEQQAVLDAAEALGADAAALETQLAAIHDTLTQAGEITERATAYQTAVQQAIDDANAALAAADVSGVSAEAKQQAKDAALAALKDTGLSEEEQQQAAQKIADGVDVSDETAQAEAQIAKAQAALANLPTFEAEELTLDTAKLEETAADMQKQLNILSGYAKTLSGMSDTMTQLSGSLDALRSGVDQLAGGSAQLSDGIDAFNAGIAQLADGTAALAGGTSQLYAAGTELSGGFGTLAAGGDALADGMRLFDEEGIQTLTDTADDDLGALLDRVQALKKADDSYRTFSGLQSGKTGSVKFIIETDELKKD